MAFTYDPTTDRGRVRLLISDINAAEATLQFFQDDAIDAFLAMARGTGVPKVKRAAADALHVIAADIAMVDRVIRTQDLQTDGAKTAEALRALAKSLRDDANVDEDEADDGQLHVLDFYPHNYLLAQE